MNNQLNFFFPKTIRTAAKFLLEHPYAKIIAGGTDIIVKWKNGLIPNLSHFVDITKLGLDRILVSNNKVIIGSCCTMSQIAESTIIKEKYPALVQAASQVGALQIRNLATIGGNIGNASPAGDTIPALISLEAQVVLSNNKRKRKVPLEEFFTGPGKTIIEQNEIIEAFELSNRETIGVFIKLGERLAHAISKVAIAISSWWKPGKTHRVYRIALGAVAPTVIRCRRAEALLEGTIGYPSEQIIDQAATLVTEEVRPIDDVRSTMAYRKKMSGVLLKRALNALKINF